MVRYLLAIITVWEFPPKVSLRSHVNTESLYGTKRFLKPFENFDDRSAKMKKRYVSTL